MKDHRKERAEARKKAEKLVSQMTLLEKASQLKYDAAPVKRLGVPAYNYWNEALHGVARAGVATMFPQAIAMAAVFDDEEMKKVGDIIATEGRAKYNALYFKSASSQSWCSRHWVRLPQMEMTRDRAKPPMKRRIFFEVGSKRWVTTFFYILHITPRRLAVIFVVCGGFYTIGT